MAKIGSDIMLAARLLSEGKLVAIPTETVYGLAANALDAAAVASIFEAKNRPHFDPLIIHVPDLEAARHYADNIPSRAALLADHFWPGPLTLVLPKRDLIPDLVSAGLPTVGIRCPDHAMTRDLLHTLPFPLAAPSANPFGYVSPVTAHHVNDQLGERISYILDGGRCRVGIESTIVGFEGDSVIIYRMGGVPVEAIENIAGSVEVNIHSSSNPKAPGQLKSHYAPDKEIVLGDIEEFLNEHSSSAIGVISFQTDYRAKHQFVLSPEGSLAVAAQNLFTALRLADHWPVDMIITERVPDTGLGRAINDRLTRAAHSGR